LRTSSGRFPHQNNDKAYLYGLLTILAGRALASKCETPAQSELISILINAVNTSLAAFEHPNLAEKRPPMGLLRWGFYMGSNDPLKRCPSARHILRR
jgi:hypothetical protein